jgi:hypothetical protein
MGFNYAGYCPFSVDAARQSTIVMIGNIGLGIQVEYIEAIVRRKR